MLLAAHTLAGAAVGEIAGDPVPAFLIGIVIHFCLDAIPHYDTTDGGEYTVRQILLAGGDFFVGLVTLYAVTIFNKQTDITPVLAGALGGIFPDLIGNPPFMKRLLNRNVFGRLLIIFHTNIQKINLPIIPGLAVQIMIWAISLYLLCQF